MAKRCENCGYKKPVKVKVVETNLAAEQLANLQQAFNMLWVRSIEDSNAAARRARLWLVYGVLIGQVLTLVALLVGKYT